MDKSVPLVSDITAIMTYDEQYLWPVFSEYIRLRDITDRASVPGLVQCFTCKRFIPWKESQCGHGVSRRHMATKYNEMNNHAQCIGCNLYKGGMPIEYERQVIARYGAHAWDLLQSTARQLKKRTKPEWDLMIAYYKNEVRKLKHHVKA